MNTNLSKLALISFLFTFIFSNCTSKPRQPISSQPETLPTSVEVSIPTSQPSNQQLPSFVETPTTQANIPSQTNWPSGIKLAWYYNKPRTDEDMVQIVDWYDLFILIKGDERARDQIRASGVDGPILQYLDFESIHDPGSCDEWPQENQVADQPGDFCRISQEHPDWFLLDMNGERMLLTEDDNEWYLMDPGNTGWQAFFMERVRQNMMDPGWDGVFLDNVEVTFAFFEDDERLPAQYPTEAAYQAATQGFLEYLHKGYFQPNGKLLFANLVARKDDADWTRYINHLDGVMHEGWAIDWPDRFRSPGTWEKHMRLAEQTQSMGKFIILVSQGTKEDQDLQQFAFASYLLINHGKAIFRYANSSLYREVWLYDNYRTPLGDPVGPRYLDGDTWHRDFTNGTVMVNPVTHTSKIEIFNK